MQGLNTFAPTITLADGTVAEGCYEDTIGTCLLMEEPLRRSTSSSGDNRQDQLKYLGQTEKLLFARLPNQRKQPTRTTLQQYS